jgi:hypothetical protein
MSMSLQSSVLGRFLSKCSGSILLAGRTGAVFKERSVGFEDALNFDGGPIACQSVCLNGFQRKFHAQWEAQVNGQAFRWPFGKSWAMPMVVTVDRK